MKKTKRLWSWALAGALAVSNLSVVVAPISSIVAQAAEAKPAAGHLLAVTSAGELADEALDDGTLPISGNLLLVVQTSTDGTKGNLEGQLTGMAATDSIEWSIDDTSGRFSIQSIGNGETAILSASNQAQINQFVTVTANYATNGVKDSTNAWAKDSMKIYVKAGKTDNVKITDSTGTALSDITLKSSAGSDGRMTLLAEANPVLESGKELAGAAYSWYSSDANLVSVDSTGTQVTATVINTALTETKTATIYVLSDVTDNATPANHYYGKA